MIIKYTILATVVALCTTEAKFLRQNEEHRLLSQGCDPTPSCTGDECQFPGCSSFCPGKYIFNQEPATFEEHKSIAESKGGNLVMIQSSEKMRCIDNLMKLKTNFVDGYWLGGTGTAGKYSWLNGDCVPQRPDAPRKQDDWCPNSPSYQRWSASQPDCYPGDYYCPGDGCMWVWTDGNWDDILCYEKKWGLYEIPNSGGGVVTPYPHPNPNPSVQGQPIDIVFAINLSSSMCKKKDLAGETWLGQTKDAVTTFINKMSTHAPSTSMAGTSGVAYTYGNQVFNLLTRDLKAASDFVTGLGCHQYVKKNGYTLNKALELFDASTRPDTESSTKAIILITDYKASSATCNQGFVSNLGNDVFKERGITIYTVGYGTDAEEGDVALSVIANCGISGGFFRRSDGASADARIFDEIFRDITN